jgi:hypothetical protein
MVTAGGVYACFGGLGRCGDGAGPYSHVASEKGALLIANN